MYLGGKEYGTYLGIMGITVLPSLMLIKSEWEAAALLSLILLFFYKYAPPFISYKEKIKGFRKFVIVINLAGLLSAMFIYIYPELYLGIIVIWIIFLMLYGFKMSFIVESTFGKN